MARCKKHFFTDEEESAFHSALYIYHGLYSDCSGFHYTAVMEVFRSIQDNKYADIIDTEKHFHLTYTSREVN